MEIASWLLVIITGIYTYVTYRLLAKNQETIDITRMSFAVLNNPYVGYAGATLKEMNGNEYAQIDFTNFGKVPVNNVRLLGRLSDTEANAKKNPLKELVSASTVFPGAIHSMPELIEESLFQDVVKYKKPLILRVELYCVDLEGKNYVHYFLGSYNHDYKNFQVLESWAGHVERCPYKISDLSVAPNA